MIRRSFFKALSTLAALPVVGKLLPEAASRKYVTVRPHNLADMEYAAKYERAMNEYIRLISDTSASLNVDA
jgi:hypothetical protein